jgi:hypothetical protein
LDSVGIWNFEFLVNREKGQKESHLCLNPINPYIKNRAPTTPKTIVNITPSKYAVYPVIIPMSINAMPRAIHTGLFSLLSMLNFPLIC